MKNTTILILYVLMVAAVIYSAQQSRLQTTGDSSAERNSFEYPMLD